MFNPIIIIYHCIHERLGYVSFGKVIFNDSVTSYYRTSILEPANYTPFNYRKAKIVQRSCDYAVNDDETRIKMICGYEFDVVYKTVQYEMSTYYDS